MTDLERTYWVWWREKFAICEAPISSLSAMRQYQEAASEATSVATPQPQDRRMKDVVAPEFVVWAAGAARELANDDHGRSKTLKEVLDEIQAMPARRVRAILATLLVTECVSLHLFERAAKIQPQDEGMRDELR